MSDYDKTKRLNHRLNCLFLFLYTSLLILTIVTIWLFKKKKVPFLHETGLAIIYGLLIGFILKFGIGLPPGFDREVTKLHVIPEESELHFNDKRTFSPPRLFYIEFNYNQSPEYMEKQWVYEMKGFLKNDKALELGALVNKKVTFDPAIFFNVILPPIIFYAGFSMRRRYFFNNIGSICMFAFIGTAISTFTVGGIMFGITRASEHLHAITFLDTLYFGAIISCVDPVTVIAIFNDLNVDVDLYALVFGESIFNDAATVVFVKAIENLKNTRSQCHTDSCFGISTFFVLLADFLRIFGVSFIVGSAMGCANASVTKYSQINKYPLLETTIFFLMSYSSYLILELFGLCGIVGVLFCGICQAHYTYKNLSPQSQAATKWLFELLNLVAENFIFSYIGVSVFIFPHFKFDIVIIAGAFLSIIIGRGLNIYPLSAILNMGRQKKLSYRLQHMMFLSGLRGAVAFALSIRTYEDESEQIILSTTIPIVIVTVIVNGGCTMPLINWLGLVEPIGTAASSTMPSLTYGTDTMSEMQSLTSADMMEVSNLQKRRKSFLAKKWSQIDKRYVKPLLTHYKPALGENMQESLLEAEEGRLRNEEKAAETSNYESRPSDICQSRD